MLGQPEPLTVGIR